MTIENPGSPRPEADEAVDHGRRRERAGCSQRDSHRRPAEACSPGEGADAEAGSEGGRLLRKPPLQGRE